MGDDLPDVPANSRLDMDLPESRGTIAAKADLDRLRRMGRLSVLREREPHFAWSKLSLLEGADQARPGLRGLSIAEAQRILASDHSAFDTFFNMAEALGGPELMERFRQCVFWNKNLFYIRGLKMSLMIAGVNADSVNVPNIVKYLPRRFNQWSNQDRHFLADFTAELRIEWLTADLIIQRDVEWRNIEDAQRILTRQKSAMGASDSSSPIVQATFGTGAVRDSEGASGNDLDECRDGVKETGRIVGGSEAAEDLPADYD